MLSQVLVGLLLVVPFGFAHPSGVEEKVYQHSAQPLYRRSLSHCESALQESENVKRTIARRQAEVDRLKKERGIEHKPIIQPRQLATWLAKNHRVYKPFTKDTKAADLFADDGACMMEPLVSEGPLYVSGEQIKRNLTEDETGVPMTIDIQVVDVKTCNPLQDVAVDIWGCNTTGIYSGVWNYYKRADGDKGYDRSVINRTALRGIQFTNEEGVAAFDTFFPGHYDGRAVHIHAMVHTGVKREANGTITGGSVVHIGQLYFDQALITMVEKTKPYTENKQTLTLNADDGLLHITPNGEDPFFRYVLLGDKIEDGIFAYIRFGVDPTASYTVTPAAMRDSSGGHQNPTGPMGDGSTKPHIPDNPKPNGELSHG